MFIYCNNNKEIYFPIEEQDLDKLNISYENLIYSHNGIYKKYKKHYYLLNINNEHKRFVKDKFEYFIQNNINTIDKNNIITTIPYHHYFVNRKIIKCIITDNISIIKEIDNNIYISYYFEVNNDSDEIIDEICLFLNKKV